MKKGLKLAALFDTNQQITVGPITEQEADTLAKLIGPWRHKTVVFWVSNREGDFYNWHGEDGNFLNRLGLSALDLTTGFEDRDELELCGDRYTVCHCQRGWHLGSVSRPHDICFKKAGIEDKYVFQSEILGYSKVFPEPLHEFPACRTSTDLLKLINAIKCRQRASERSKAVDETLKYRKTVADRLNLSFVVADGLELLGPQFATKQRVPGKEPDFYISTKPIWSGKFPDKVKAFKMKDGSYQIKDINEMTYQIPPSFVEQSGLFKPVYMQEKKTFHVPGGEYSWDELKKFAKAQLNQK